MHPHFRYPAAAAVTVARRDFDDRAGHCQPTLVRWGHREVMDERDKRPHHTVVFHYADGSTTSYNGTWKG